MPTIIQEENQLQMIQKIIMILISYSKILIKNFTHRPLFYEEKICPKNSGRQDLPYDVTEEGIFISDV